MAREENDGMGAVFGFVLDQRHRAAGVSAQPCTRSFRAPGRKEAVFQRHAAPRTHRHPAPFRPDQLPPAIARHRPELVPPLRERQFPGCLRRHTDFAVDFVAVAPFPQAVDVEVEGIEVRFGADPLAGKVGGQAVLPDEMDALDKA